jgi:hypothetical protein
MGPQGAWINSSPNYTQTYGLILLLAATDRMVGCQSDYAGTHRTKTRKDQKRRRKIKNQVGHRTLSCLEKVHTRLLMGDLGKQLPAIDNERRDIDSLPGHAGAAPLNGICHSLRCRAWTRTDASVCSKDQRQHDSQCWQHPYLAGVR